VSEHLGPRPGPVPGATSGVAQVEEARALLEGLEGAAVAEHVAVFDAVHRRLQDALASLDPQDERP